MLRTSHKVCFSSDVSWSGQFLNNVDADVIKKLNNFTQHNYKSNSFSEVTSEVTLHRLFKLSISVEK